MNAESDNWSPNL